MLMLPGEVKVTSYLSLDDIVKHIQVAAPTECVFCYVAGFII